jgi:hypothetical protein
MATNPSQRTLNYLRRLGWPHVQVVEQWIPQARRRRDLFAFADILAMHPQWGHLYVQATSGSNANARLNKMREWSPRTIEDAVKCGAVVEIHGWRKLKGKGRRQWFPRIINVGIDEVYNMNDIQWQAVRGLMSGVYRNLEATELERGGMIATVRSDDYPPSIEIEVVSKVGEGDGRVKEFSRKELVLASELAVELCDGALKSNPYLKLQKARYTKQFALSYSLRPEVYSSAPGVAELEGGDATSPANNDL